MIGVSFPFLSHKALPAGPAPAITRAFPLADVYYPIGFSDPTGGNDIRVRGTGFVDGASLEWRQSGVTIGSATGGGCVVVSDTNLFATCPMLPPGIYDLVVVNPDAQDSGASGNGKHKAWFPNADACSGLFLPGAYSVAGTQGTDAVGTWADASGNGYDFASGVVGFGAFPGFSPEASADGYPVIDASTTQGLARLATSLAGDQGVGYVALCEPSDGAMVVIAKWSGALTSYGGTYTNPAMVCGSGASAGLLADRKGVRFEGYDAVEYVEAQSFSFDPDVVTVCAGKWDSSGVYSSTMGKPWSSLAPYTGAQTSLSAGDVGPDTYIGTGYGGAGVWNGDIVAVAFYPSASQVDDAKLADWNMWAILHGYVEAITAIDPATLPLSHLHAPPFSGMPWTGLLSAGDSAGRDLTASGSDPTAPSGVPDFDGLQYMTDSASNADLFSAGVGTVIGLMVARTAPAPSGADYGDGNLYTDFNNAETTFGFTSGGACACIIEGGVTYTRVNVPGSVTGALKMLSFRFDDSWLTGCSGGEVAGVACGPWVPTNPGGGLVGRGYIGSQAFDGSLYYYITSAYALPYATIEGVRRYFVDLYGAF